MQNSLKKLDKNSFFFFFLSFFQKKILGWCKNISGFLKAQILAKIPEKDFVFGYVHGIILKSRVKGHDFFFAHN
jgi:hypothetical protein